MKVNPAAPYPKLKFDTNFLKLVEESPAATAVLQANHEKTFRFVNHAFLEIFHKNGSIVNQPLLHAIPELRATEIEKLFEQAANTGTVAKTKALPLFFGENGQHRLFDITVIPHKQDAATTPAFSLLVNATPGGARAQYAEQGNDIGFELAELVPTTIWVTDQTGFCTYLNSSWYKMTGQSREEALGYGWLDIIHPDDKESTGKIFNAANVSQTPFQLSYRLRQMNGDYRWAIDTGRPRFDSENRFAGFIGSVVDVHDEKMANAKLTEVATHLQLAITSAGVGTWSYDVRSRRIFWSDLHKRMWGYPVDKDDLYFDDWSNLIHPEDRQNALHVVEESRIRRQVYDIEYRIIRKTDKSIRWIRSAGQYTFDDGEPISLTGISIDITDQKTSEEQLKIALDGGELGFFDFYPQTEKLIWSEKTRKLYGIPSTSPVTFNTFRMTLHPDDADRTIKTSREAMESATGGNYENEFRIIRLIDKQTRWIRSKGKAYFTAEGKCYRFTGVVQDVTAQKEALQSLQLQALVLEQMVEGVSISDENGTILYTNSAEDKMFGYARGELQGKHVTIQNAYEPEANIRIVQEVIDHLKQNGFWSGEWHNRRKDGSNFYTFSFITRVAVDGSTRFVCVQRDITEEKKSREALTKSEKRYSSLAKATSAIIWITDVEGAFVLPQPSWETYTGQTIDEYMGFGWMKMVHPDDREQAANLWRKSLREKKTYEAEARIWSNAHQDYRYLVSKAVPVPGDNERALEWIGVNTDIHDHRIAEEKLRRSENRYRHIFEGTPVSVWEEDFSSCRERILELRKRGVQDFTVFFKERPAELKYMLAKIRINDVNHATLELVEASSKQEIFEGLDQILIEDSTHALIREIEIIANGGGSFKYESTIKTLKGKIIEVLVHIDFPLHDDYSSVLVTLVDISERKKAEKELSVAKSRLETVLKNFPSGIFLFDRMGHTIFINDIAAQWNGFTSSEKHIESVDFEHLKERFTDTFALHREDGTPLPLHETPTSLVFKTLQPSEGVLLILNKKENNTKWIYVKAAPMLDGAGNLDMVLSTVTDITEQKMAEGKIRESENYFRTLTNSLPQLIWTTNTHGAVDFFNDQWYLYTGDQRRQSPDDAWLQFIHPHDQDRIMEQWKQSLDSGIPIKTEIRLRRNDGVYNWFFAVGTPIRNASGKILKWVGTVTNIEERKEIEEQLEQLVKERTAELERSNLDLQQFAHVTSHDLKEPLRKIKTFTYRIQDEDEYLSEKNSIYISKVLSAAERMNKMIDGVLTYSTVNSVQQQTEKIDLKEIILAIESDLEVLIHQKAAKISIDELPAIEGANVLIYQLFYNLINNSLKFSRSGVPPEITISERMIDPVDSKNVTIRLTDNGIGFESEYALKIFDPFTRLNSKDLYEGTGLGLALCKKIVERHGGSIEAKSIPLEGSTFDVRLPKIQNRSRI